MTARNGESTARAVDRHHVCVLGAAGDTTNLGVDALLESTVIGLRQALPDVSLTVFDNGLGQRHGAIPHGDSSIGFERLGIRSSRRVYRPESLTNMDVSARLGLRWNSGVERMRASDVVVDISGGDSFSDIYGQARFDAIARQKAVVLRTGAPLVLLPQTFGPFRNDKNRSIAQDLVRGVAASWARDAISYDVLRTLAGDEVDGNHHRLGVDVAFALPAREPAGLAPRIRALLPASVPLLGINVSGLLANDRRSDLEFGLCSDYTELIHRIIRRVLADTDAHILLVPHVLSDLWVVESDVAACRRFAAEIGTTYADRVAVLEGIDRAQDVKWVIAQCDAFCGTRMHSTIAALSSHTPAVALAYSDKTWGVFDSCGQGHNVLDLRRSDPALIAQHVLDVWKRRNEIVDELRAAVPSVAAQAKAPFDAIAASLEARG